MPRCRRITNTLFVLPFRACMKDSVFRFLRPCLTNARWSYQTFQACRKLQEKRGSTWIRQTYRTLQGDYLPPCGSGILFRGKTVLMQELQRHVSLPGKKPRKKHLRHWRPYETAYRFLGLSMRPHRVYPE